MATVWVVDDEAPVREVLEAMLQQMGHTSRVFSDGAALLAAYQRGQADLVISDIRMPGLDGLSLLRALRAKDHHAVVILLTGYPAIQDGVEAIRLGAADYLTKPFRMEEINLRILRALESRDLNQQLRRSRILAWLLIGSLPFWFVLGLVLHLLMACP